MKRIYVTPEAEASCMLTEQLIAQSGDFVSPSIAEDETVVSWY